MAARQRIAAILYWARIPALLAIISGAVGFAMRIWDIGLAPDLVLGATGVTFIAAAGWLVVRRGRLTLWDAGAAGAAVLLADCLGIALWFFVSGERLAAGGVLLSYVLFFWVGMALGALGGAIAGHFSNAEAVPPNSALHADAKLPPI